MERSKEVEDSSNFLQPMPWILEMSVNPSRDLRDRSCEACGDLNPLGAMCCGMLIGDSQTSYWYLALECFLVEYLVQAPRAAPTNNSAANLWLVKFDEWRELKGSNKASPKPAVCANLKDETRVCYVRVHLVEEIAHPVLRVIKREAHGANRDIAVINSGLHYGIGDPKYEEGFAFLKNFIAEHRDELPHIVWKDTSPQHFEYHNGYYWWVDNSKGKTVGPPPEKCRAFTEEELQSEEIIAGGWYNEIAFRHMKEAGVTIFDAYKITLPMWQMHMKDKDCTHFCNPGAYEVWTYLLSDLLKGLQLRE
ncbi:g182 [Coccomyxa elongata]